MLINYIPNIYIFNLLLFIIAMVLIKGPHCRNDNTYTKQKNIVSDSSINYNAGCVNRYY